MGERKHLVALDGLRGIAAVMIVVDHFLEPTGITVTYRSYLAVDFFFCLSGFVVSLAYGARLLGGMTFWDFVRQRVNRLYPLYLIGSLIGFLVVGGRVIGPDGTLSVFVVLLAMLCQLALIPTAAISYYGNTSPFPFNSVSWSLFFKFLVNFFYAAIARYLTNGVLAVIIVISAGASILCLVVNGSFETGYDVSNLEWGFARVLYPFFTGIALHRLFVARPPARQSSSNILIWAVLLLAPMIMPQWRFAAIGEGVAVMVLFPAIVYGASRVALSPLSTRICSFMGRLSYPLYITHYPIVRGYSHVAHLPDRHGPLLAVLIVIGIALCLVVAGLLSIFVEPRLQILMKRAFVRRPTLA